MRNIDDLDIKILKTLQIDASRSLEVISESSGVSLNTCWRRIQRLEADGVIKHRVALLDHKKCGLLLTVFVSVRTDNHSKDWADSFTKAVQNLPEIVEFHRLAGDVDYILKIIAKDVSDYDRIYQRLISQVKLSDVSASFAMETLKATTALPL